MWAIPIFVLKKLISLVQPVIFTQQQTIVVSRGLNVLQGQHIMMWQINVQRSPVKLLVMRQRNKTHRKSLNIKKEENLRIVLLTIGAQVPMFSMLFSSNFRCPGVRLSSLLIVLGAERVMQDVNIQTGIGWQIDGWNLNKSVLEHNLQSLHRYTRHLNV